MCVCEQVCLCVYFSVCVCICVCVFGVLCVPVCIRALVCGRWPACAHGLVLSLPFSCWRVCLCACLCVFHPFSSMCFCMCASFRIAYAPLHEAAGARSVATRQILNGSSKGWPMQITRIRMISCANRVARNLARFITGTIPTAAAPWILTVLRYSVKKLSNYGKMDIEKDKS